MKKLLLILSFLLLTFSSFAEEKILIAYFSRFGNTNYNENTDATASASIILNGNRQMGTTERLAEIIKENVGGDIHLIKSIEEYPENFDDVVSQARAERNSAYVPELADKIENMEQYDTIFLGYPVWGTTIPAPVEAFLREYDFSGKKVIPFCTHDGYGAGRSFRDVGRLASGAEILNGLAVEAGDVNNAQREVVQWLNSIGIEKQVENNIPITVSIGNQKMSGYLYNSETAKQFLEMFPQEISMYGYGGREYYGGIEKRINTDEVGKLNFENGDITYCPQNNSIAIFYAQTDNPNLTMRVIPIGKVTGDLKIFDNLNRREVITFELNN